MHLWFYYGLNCYYLTGYCREKWVFTRFYSKLVSILPVDNIKDELVSARIITVDDIEEIDHMPRATSKASFILKIVDDSLKNGTTDNFYNLLNIIERSHNDDVKAIVRDIRSALVTGKYIYLTIHIHSYNFGQCTPGFLNLLCPQSQKSHYIKLTT